MSTLAASFKNVSGFFVRSDSPLSDEQILTAAPSVFAETPHTSRSDRYAYIPTSDVVKGLHNEGFMPFMACQARSRIEGKTEFTKHMLRFRRFLFFSGQKKGRLCSALGCFCDGFHCVLPILPRWF